MPVKLSDNLVLDARLAAEVMERSIAGQVEFWARLGRAIDPVINGSQAMALSRQGNARPLAAVLAEVEQGAGRQRLREHLDNQPYPHYEAHPDQAGLLVRIEADGRRSTGRFVNRVFTVVDDAG